MTDRQTYCDCGRGPLEEIIDNDNDTTLYTVTVPYDWSDCCYMGEGESTVEIRAKSPEEARSLAKRALESVPYVHQTHGTTIEDP